ncbi:hypothetical protein KAW64_11335, partial [bacterium]|nr:hypothetical protein [bacterium]
MTTRSPEHGHRELVRRIKAAGERWKRQAAVVGLVRLTAVIVVVLAALVALEALVVLPAVVRVAWLIGALVLLVGGAYLWMVRVLARPVDAVELAAKIEERLPDLGERLESSTELWDKRGTGRHGYSVELIDALILRTVAETAGVDFRIAPRPGSTRRTIRVAVIVLLVAVAGMVALGARLGPA